MNNAPPIVRCRGDKKKEELKNIYTIKPLTHIKLLNGQERTCCCGDKINKDNTDSECYIFSCKSKNDVSLSEFTFFVGMQCANNIINISGLKTLPLFDPLINDDCGYDDGNNKNNSRQINSSSGKTTWEPLNKELYKAINILILAWNLDERKIAKYKIINQILTYLYINPGKRTQDWAIEKINEMIGKDKKGRTTISKMLDSLEPGKTKEIEFKELKKFMDNKKNLKNNFI